MSNFLTVNQKLNEILGLAESNEDAEVVAIEAPKVITSGNPDKDMQDDFQVARTGLHALVGKGTELVDNANFFAKEKQDARSVEAASMAQKEARENLMALVNLHKVRKDIERVSSVSPGGDVTISQTNAFVGTTGDLLKFIKDLGGNKLLADSLKTIDASPDDPTLNKSKE